MAKSGTKRNVKRDAAPKESLPGANDGEQMDKIREILYGSQMRHVDKRFGKLEKLFQDEIDGLRSETEKKLASLENYFRKEIDALTSKINGETTDRTRSSEALAQRIDTAQKMLEEKIGQLSEKALQDNRDVQDQILTQSKELLEAIRSDHDKLSAMMENSFRSLSEDKTDRETLANLFTEVAMRLRDEFDLPKSGE